MRALGHRLKAAAIGFGATVPPLLIVAVVQLTFLPQIVGKIEGFDSKEQAWLISSMRYDWIMLYSSAVILVIFYWLLAAVLGNEKLLQSRSANLTLAFFVLGFLVLTLYYDFFQSPVELKGLCPLLGISDTDAPPFGFDVPSSCGVFAAAAHPIIVLGLLGLSMMFLAASAVIRIASSRRARSTNG